jgi:hypothetical protein
LGKIGKAQRRFDATDFLCRFARPSKMNPAALALSEPKAGMPPGVPLLIRSRICAAVMGRERRCQSTYNSREKRDYQ